MSMLQLTPDEHDWLEAYRRTLQERYPGVVLRLVIYGSKARGEAHPDSDVDVLLIVTNRADHLKRPLRRLGYELASAYLAGNKVILSSGSKTSLSS